MVELAEKANTLEIHWRSPSPLTAFNESNRGNRKKIR